MSLLADYSDVPGSERPDPSLRPLRWKQTFGILSKEDSSYKKGSCQLQKRSECQVEMNVPKFQKTRLADGNGEYQRRVVLIQKVMGRGKAALLVQEGATTRLQTLEKGIRQTQRKAHTKALSLP